LLDFTLCSTVMLCTAGHPYETDVPVRADTGILQWVRFWWSS